MASPLLRALVALKLCLSCISSSTPQLFQAQGKQFENVGLKMRFILTLTLLILLGGWGFLNLQAKSTACDDICKPDGATPQTIQRTIVRKDDFNSVVPVGLSTPPHNSKQPHLLSNKPKRPHVRSGQAASLPDELDLYGLVVKIEPLPKSAPRLKPSQLLSTSEDEPVQRVTVRLSINPKSLGLKSDLVQVEHVLVKNPAYRIPLKPGTRVLLNAERKPGTQQWTFYIANRDRTPALMILGALTVMAILLIGGPSVAKHILLSVIVLYGCYNALFPAIRQYETGPLWIFLICAMYTILGTFIYQRPGTKHFSREQCVVILSTLGGLSILTAILWVMHEITPLDGYTSENLAALWYDWPKLDYWSFYLGSAILGFQGFIFYLCWSLAQNRSKEEILTFWERFNIVMLRGRNTLGPLLSSLSLLFIGLLMPILLQLDGTPTAQLVNLESTAAMLTFAFSGGLTLLLTVPLTALVAAWQLKSACTATPKTIPD